MNGKEVASLYDDFSEEYRSYSEKKSRYINKIDSLIVDEIGNRRINYMLDYGCGDGLRGYKLFQKFKADQLVQADVSDEMLKKASRIASSTKIITLSLKSNGMSVPLISGIVSLSLKSSR